MVLFCAEFLFTYFYRCKCDASGVCHGLSFLAWTHDETILAVRSCVRTTTHTPTPPSSTIPDFKARYCPLILSYQRCQRHRTYGHCASCTIMAPNYRPMPSNSLRQLQARGLDSPLDRPIPKQRSRNARGPHGRHQRHQN